VRVCCFVVQIAGRAGRKSSRWPEGEATCLRGEDLAYLHQALTTPVKPIAKAGLFPSQEQLEAFSARLALPELEPEKPLNRAGEGGADTRAREGQGQLMEAMTRFFRLAQLGEHYFLCRSGHHNTTTP
jgi:hypothetical protein